MVTVSVPATALLAPVSAQTAVPAGLHSASVVTFGEVFAPGATLDALLEASFDIAVTWRTMLVGRGMSPDALSSHIGARVSFGNPGEPYPTHVRVTVTPRGAVTCGLTLAVV